jgi:hypothetical protein
MDGSKGCTTAVASGGVGAAGLEKRDSPLEEPRKLLAFGNGAEVDVCRHHPPHVFCTSRSLHHTPAPPCARLPSRNGLRRGQLGCAASVQTDKKQAYTSPGYVTRFLFLHRALQLRSAEMLGVFLIAVIIIARSGREIERSEGCNARSICAKHI